MRQLPSIRHSLTTEAMLTSNRYVASLFCTGSLRTEVYYVVGQPPEAPLDKPLRL